MERDGRDARGRAAAPRGPGSARGARAGARRRTTAASARSRARRPGRTARRRAARARRAGPAPDRDLQHLAGGGGERLGIAGPRRGQRAPARGPPPPGRAAGPARVTRCPRAASAAASAATCRATSSRAASACGWTSAMRRGEVIAARQARRVRRTRATPAATRCAAVIRLSPARIDHQHRHHVADAAEEECGADDDEPLRAGPSARRSTRRCRAPRRGPARTRRGTTPSGP